MILTPGNPLQWMSDQQNLQAVAIECAVRSSPQEGNYVDYPGGGLPDKGGEEFAWRIQLPLQSTAASDGRDASESWLAGMAKAIPRRSQDATTVADGLAASATMPSAAWRPQVPGPGGEEWINWACSVSKPFEPLPLTINFQVLAARG
jgi:hypothetical protein